MRSVQLDRRLTQGITILLSWLLISDTVETSNWSSCLRREIPRIAGSVFPLLSCCFAYVSICLFLSVSRPPLPPVQQHRSAICVTYRFWRCSPWILLWTPCFLLPRSCHQHACSVLASLQFAVDLVCSAPQDVLWYLRVQMVALKIQTLDMKIAISLSLVFFYLWSTKILKRPGNLR